MQFPPNVQSEIVIPSSVPFAPGNDVIGIGFQVPAELQAAGINAAMIFYNSAYSPTSTLPRVVYSFIGQAVTPDPDYSVGVITGFTWQTDPAANSPLIVVATLITGMGAPSGSGYTFLECVVGGQNHNQDDIWGFSEDGTSNGNGKISLQNDSGTHTAYNQPTTVHTAGDGPYTNTWSLGT